MSNSQIKVDYAHLESLSTKLNTALGVIGQELEASVVLGTNCGDVRLGAKIVDFGQSWNKHRFDIRDTLEWLQGSITNIQTQLKDLDTQLAAGLGSGGGGGNGR